MFRFIMAPTIVSPSAQKPPTWGLPCLAPDNLGLGFARHSSSRGREGGRVGEGGGGVLAHGRKRQDAEIGLWNGHALLRVSQVC